MAGGAEQEAQEGQRQQRAPGGGGQQEVGQILKPGKVQAVGVEAVEGHILQRGGYSENDGEASVHIRRGVFVEPVVIDIGFDEPVGAAVVIHLIQTALPHGVGDGRGGDDIAGDGVHDADVGVDLAAPAVELGLGRLLALIPVGVGCIPGKIGGIIVAEAGLKETPALVDAVFSAEENAEA